MPSEAEIQTLEQEWRKAGHSDAEIGTRLQAMVEREAAEAEAEPVTESGESPGDTEPGQEPEAEPDGEPQAGAQTDERTGPPEDDWPLCGVCGGNGRIPPGLKEAPDKMQCPDCNGYGMSQTGSLVPEAAVLPCPTCGGNGYVSKPPPPYVPPEQQPGYERTYP